MKAYIVSIIVQGLRIQQAGKKTKSTPESLNLKGEKVTNEQQDTGQLPAGFHLTKYFFIVGEYICKQYIMGLNSAQVPVEVFSEKGLKLLS